MNLIRKALAPVVRAVFGYCPEFAIRVIDARTADREAEDIARGKLQEEIDLLTRTAAEETIKRTAYEKTLRAIGGARGVPLSYVVKVALAALARHDEPRA